MRLRGSAWVVPTVVTTAAAVLLLVRLGTPAELVFDEVYYVEDARSILDRGVEQGFAVHPPVGKWLIAAGIAVVGDTPAGWRVVGAVVGALTVLLTVLVARRLTGRCALAALAGGLLALDGVFVVQARTAMLDVHLAGFVALGAYLLVVDHQRSRPALLRARWPLLLAGVAFGLAVATKWSGALALLAAGALVAVWELVERRRDGRSTLRASGSAVATVVAGLAVPALAVYVLAWAPWLVQFERTRTAEVVCDDRGDAADCGFTVGDRVAGLVRHHADIARFHLQLEAEHPYRAPATTWPVQARPVVYHWDTCGPEDEPASCTVAPGNAAEIVGLGNPVVWWGGLALLPVLVAGAVRRDGRSSVPIAFLAAQYLPWLVVARPVFSFYAVPLVPFLTIAIVVACGELDRAWRWLTSIAGTVLGAALGAVGATLAGAGAAGVGTTAALGALGGAAAGTAVDTRLGRPADPEPVRRAGSTVAAVLAVLAVAAAVYFAPIWLAIELAEDAIRHRWWFSGWI